MLKRFKTYVTYSTCALGVFSASIAYAQNGYMSEEEALKKFEEASKMFEEGYEPADKNDKITDVEFPTKSKISKEVVHKQPSLKVDGDEHTENASVTIQPTLDKSVVRLQDVPVVLDVENATMANVMEEVLMQVVPYSGKWNVKWRLEDENRFIASERVNLTAETTFGGFVEYLTDRVNNMTGIELFVTVFNNSRIIVISDTYY